MRILVFGLTDNIGGIETMFMQYYKNLQSEKFCFDFVTIFDSIAFEDEIRKMGSKIYKIVSPKKNPIAYRKQITEILKNNQYDCVYVNMLSAANIVPLQVAKKCGVKKIVAHSHNANTPKGLLRKILHSLNRQKIQKLANIKLACSKKAGDWLFNKKQDYYILNNLVDQEKYSYKKELSDLYRTNKKQYIIGHIGRFSEQKNQDFILDIAKMIEVKDKSIKFILIGKGKNLKHIQYRIRNEKIKNVFISKALNDTSACYSGFDLFILPSKFEGLPVVGIEAQINGVPSIFSSTITRETKISNSCNFIDLDEKEWVRAICKKPKRANVKLVNNSNLSIAKNQRKLLEILERNNGQ